MKTITKLVAMASAVSMIGSIAFEFTPYSSQNSLIKQGVDSLKAMVQGKDAQLKQLQAEYDEVIANLDNANQSLETARAKLQAIYQKITGQAWDEANGDILNFDFNSLIKDGNQFENNVDGDAIASILGLPAGSSTQQIIVAIQNLQEQIADLAEQVQNLQQQVADLQAEITTYKEEESALVLDLQAQIDDLKARAESEANAIIEEANQEEQEQLEYINNTINELENPQQAPEQGGEESGTEEGQGVVLSGDWSSVDESVQNAFLTMFNELGIQNVEVTPSMLKLESNYVEIKVPSEAYNVMVAHEYYHAATESLYISDAGNIVDRAVANPDGKAIQPDGYIRVRIYQQ